MDRDFKVLQELQGNESAITCVGANGLRVYAGDEAGGCCVWDKLNEKRPVEATKPASLHDGAVVAMDVDPHFVYTVGRDKVIGVWEGKWLNEMLRLHVTEPPVEALTGVIRPSSRWGLSQGPNRGVREPSGKLFVTALSAVGEGLLMEWHLGARECQSCKKAHEGQITALAYGPYDNGPVITCGQDKNLAIWETSPLRCTRKVEGAGAQEILGLCVEPQYRIFSLAGDGWLKVWTLVGGGAVATEAE